MRFQQVGVPQADQGVTSRCFAALSMTGPAVGAGVAGVKTQAYRESELFRRLGGLPDC